MTLTCKNTPRSGPFTSFVQDGWRVVFGPDGWPTQVPLMRKIVSNWLPVKCGALPKDRGPDCSGCINNDEA